MVVKVALWCELWTSLMDLCWIIFLLSDLITEQALILLHAHRQNGGGPQQEEHIGWPNGHVFIEILRRLPPAPCSAANVYVAPRNASSQTTIS